MASTPRKQRQRNIVEQAEEGTGAGMSGNLGNNQGSSTKKVEKAMQAAKSVDTEIDTLRRECILMKKKVKIVKTSAEEKRLRLARGREINAHLNARIEAVNNEISARTENLDKEKKLAQIYVRQKNEVQEKMVEKRTMLDKKREEWRIMAEDVSKQRQDFENKCASVPWMAEFKKAYDENKRLAQEIDELRSSMEVQNAMITEMEAEMSKSEDADGIWNKACIQFANDMLHVRRMSTEIDELTKQMDMERQRQEQQKKAMRDRAQQPLTPGKGRQHPGTPQVRTPQSEAGMLTPTSRGVSNGQASTPQMRSPYKTPNAAASRPETPAATIESSPRAVPKSPAVGNRQMQQAKSPFMAPAPPVARSSYGAQRSNASMMVSPKPVQQMTNPAAKMIRSPKVVQDNVMPRQSPSAYGRNATNERMDFFNLNDGEDMASEGSINSNGNGSGTGFNFFDGYDNNSENDPDDGPMDVGFPGLFGNVDSGDNDEEEDGDGGGFRMLFG